MQRHSAVRDRANVVEVRVSLSDITKTVPDANVSNKPGSHQPPIRKATKNKAAEPTTAAAAAAVAVAANSSNGGLECSVLKVKGPISAESRELVDKFNDLKKSMFVMKEKAKQQQEAHDNDDNLDEEEGRAPASSRVQQRRQKLPVPQRQRQRPGHHQRRPKAAATTSSTTVKTRARNKTGGAASGLSLIHI